MHCCRISFAGGQNTGEAIEVRVLVNARPQLLRHRWWHKFRSTDAATALDLAAARSHPPCARNGGSRKIFTGGLWDAGWMVVVAVAATECCRTVRGKRN